jgi:hypothetical protein
MTTGDYFLTTALLARQARQFIECEVEEAPSVAELRSRANGVVQGAAKLLVRGNDGLVEVLPSTVHWWSSPLFLINQITG